MCSLGLSGHLAVGLFEPAISSALDRLDDAETDASWGSFFQSYYPNIPIDFSHSISIVSRLQTRYLYRLNLLRRNQYGNEADNGRFGQFLTTTSPNVDNLEIILLKTGGFSQ